MIESIKILETSLTDRTMELLNARTIGKKAKAYAAKRIESAKYFEKLHAAGVGYYTNLLDENKKRVGRLVPSSDGVILEIMTK